MSYKLNSEHTDWNTRETEEKLTNIMCATLLIINPGTYGCCRDYCSCRLLLDGWLKILICSHAHELISKIIFSCIHNDYNIFNVYFVDTLVRAVACELYLSELFTIIVEWYVFFIFIFRNLLDLDKTFMKGICRQNLYVQSDWLKKKSILTKSR